MLNENEGIIENDLFGEKLYTFFEFKGGAVMKKRCIAIMLTIALAVVNILPTFAVEPSVECGATLDSIETEYIEDNYVSYTLDIEASSSRLTPYNNNDDIAEESYEKAVDYVNSLDLSDHPEVKQKNIEYLNALHEAGANITEYTVLVPQYDDGFMIYGTRYGMTYYSKYYANASYEVMENEYDGYLLNEFCDGLVSLFVDLVGQSNVLSLGWSVFSSIMGIPPGYEVGSGDRIESKVKVVATLRGIYTQDVQMFYGLNPYNFICVYTGEAGTARLYAVYHFSTTSGIPEASGWLSDESFVQTQYYYDKEATLDMAATIYFAKGQAHDYLYEEVINNSEIYFT